MPLGNPAHSNNELTLLVTTGWEGSGYLSNEARVTPPGKSSRSAKARDKSEGKSDWIVEEGKSEHRFGPTPNSLPLVSIPPGEEPHRKHIRAVPRTRVE